MNTLTALLVLALGASPAVGAFTSIDRLVDPFPTQIAWSPNTLVSLDSNNLSFDIDQQGTVSGAIGGPRHTSYTSGNAGFGDNASINAGSLAISSSASGAGGNMTLTYGYNQQLNADFATPGADFFSFVINGDHNAIPESGVDARPIAFVLAITSGTGTAQQASHTHALSIVDDGLHQVDLAQFKANGVDFADIDQIAITFDASANNAVDFAVSDIGISGAAIPAPASAVLVASLVLVIRPRRA